MQKRDMRGNIDAIECPGCGELGLQRIVYGMPSDDFEFDKYIMGGCVLVDFDIGCKKCGWTGFLAEIRNYGDSSTPN